jgi:tRNA(fMet)-specific endonuclease VapC
MARILIDTNVYAALMRGDESVADELARHEAILLSPIVIGELYDGFQNGTRSKENRAILERFREKPRTLCVPITDATAEWFAEIKRILRHKGKPIPSNDLWIAASCMEHGARLLSFDAHFAEIDGLLRC